MKNLRNILAAVVMMTVITFGTTLANAGIIVAGRGTKSGKSIKTQTCTQNSGILVAGLTGIIVAGFTGIIVAGVTGIIVAGASGTPQADCGIIVAG